MGRCPCKRQGRFKLHLASSQVPPTKLPPLQGMGPPRNTLPHAIRTIPQEQVTSSRRRSAAFGGIGLLCTLNMRPMRRRPDQDRQLPFRHGTRFGASQLRVQTAHPCPNIHPWGQWPSVWPSCRRVGSVETAEDGRDRIPNYFTLPNNFRSNLQILQQRSRAHHSFLPSSISSSHVPVALALLPPSRSRDLAAVNKNEPMSN
jgi:hypothetical protein